MWTTRNARAYARAAVHFINPSSCSPFRNLRNGTCLSPHRVHPTTANFNSAVAAALWVSSAVSVRSPNLRSYSQRSNGWLTF